MYDLYFMLMFQRMTMLTQPSAWVELCLFSYTSAKETMEGEGSQGFSQSDWDDNEWNGEGNDSEKAAKRAKTQPFAPGIKHFQIFDSILLTHF